MTKRFSSLLLAPLFATLLTGPPLHAQQTTSEIEGGAWSGGGGNLDEIGDVSPVKLAEALEQVKALLPYHFMPMEAPTWSTDDTALKSLVPALFPANGMNILEALAKSHFFLKLDGPCKDLDGREADAAVVGDKNNTICFSAPRLGAKLKQDNYFRRLFALAAHEVSHLLLTTQANALTVQRAALELKAERTMLTSVKGMREVLAETLIHQTVLARETLKLIEAGHNFDKVCKELRQPENLPPASYVPVGGGHFPGKVLMPISYLRYLERRELRPIRAETEQRYMALAFKFHLIGHVCTPETSEYKQNYLKGVFVGRSEIPMALAHTPPYLYAELFATFPAAASLKVRYPQYGDLKTSAVELRELLQLADEVLSEISLSAKHPELAVHTPVKAWAKKGLEALKRAGHQEVAGFPVAKLIAALEKAQISFADLWSSTEKMKVDKTKFAVVIDSWAWRTPEPQEKALLLVTAVLRLLEAESDVPAKAREIVKAFPAP